MKRIIKSICFLLSSIVLLVCSCTNSEIVSDDYGFNDNIKLYRDNKGILSIKTCWGIKRRFDWMQEASNDSLSLFLRNGKYGYINTNTGRILISARYRRAWAFSEGLAAVQTNGLIGFINHKGSMVIEPQFPAYDKELVDYSFHNGVCVVSNGKRKYGIINQRGQWILQPKYSFVSTCNEYAIVSIEEGRMMITYDGNILNQSVLDDILELSYYRGDECNYDRETHYTGFFSYCAGGQWGLMDGSGKRLTEPLYDSITALNDSMFRATLLDHCSIVLLNERGEITE